MVGRKKADVSLATVLAYIVIGGMGLFSLMPFLWPVLSAFGRKPANVSGLFLNWPQGFTLDHFREAFAPSGGDALTLAGNSLLIACSAVVTTVTVCTLGAYTLSRLQFRGKRMLMYAVLLIQFIPITVTILPYYLVMRKVGLIDTRLGVMLGLSTAQIPFCIWLMKGFFDTIPRELEEAAWIDGAGRLRALFRIVLPLSLPGLGAAVVLGFNQAWAAFFLPLVMLSSPERFVLSQGLFRAVVNSSNVDYGLMNAIGIIYMVPSLLLFFFARKYLIRGTTAGAMAGQ